MAEWGLIRVYRPVKLIDGSVRKEKFESLHQSQSVADLHRVAFLTGGMLNKEV